MNPLLYAVCSIIVISIIVSFDTWKSGRNRTLRMALIRRETSLTMYLIISVIVIWFLMWLFLEGPGLVSRAWERFTVSLQELKISNLPADDR